MVLLPYHPSITPHSIDVRKCYDYGPSVVGSRIWWCAGLGNDTIVSAPMPGRPGKLGLPYAHSDKLVADPCAANFGHETFVAFTVGRRDGSGNGIGWALWSDPTKMPKVGGMLIPQQPAGRYGIGQPSLAQRPESRDWVLLVRDDGPRRENILRAYSLRLDDPSAPRVLREIPFAQAEDGASPEAWWVDDWRLAVMISGGGYVGVRTFQFDDGALHRDRHLEVSTTLSGGGVFWAQNPIPAPGAVDGCGIERDEHNRPIISTAGNIHFWQARGEPQRPGTWLLRRTSYPLPKAALP